MLVLWLQILMSQEQLLLLSWKAGDKLQLFFTEGKHFIHYFAFRILSASNKM